MAAWMWALAGVVVGCAGMFLVMRARAMAVVTSALAQHANGLRARMEAIDARHQRTSAAARCSSSFARWRSAGGLPPCGWR